MATPTTIVGNITGDLELRMTPNGKSVVNLGVAVNTGFQNADGTWTDKVDFFDVVAWDRMAENVAASLGKGSRVIVNGNLRQRSWKAPDGSNRSKVELVAKEIGASMRWATTSVTKNSPSSADVADEAGEAVADAEPVSDEAPF